MMTQKIEQCMDKDGYLDLTKVRAQKKIKEANFDSKYELSSEKEKLDSEEE